MTNEIASELADSDRGYIIAPAGYGKTEVIAMAVGLETEGKQLLLTHTHAGVRSLRERLKRHEISSKRFRVDTIAGWSLRLASSYPQLSGLEASQPLEDQWSQVYPAVIKALQHSTIQEVVAISYSGVYVDEYQDCTKSQHELVMGLAQFLPCRVLGDPLQGIFDFNKQDPIVDWEEDVERNFPALSELQEPWRWKENNPELGGWLEEARAALLNGDKIDLRKAPRDSVRWIRKEKHGQAAPRACLAAIKKEGTVCAIHKWPRPAHRLASQLGGVFTSMEEIECRDLMSWAGVLDAAEGGEKVVELIEGAARCWTSVSKELRSIKDAFAKERESRARKYPQILEAMRAVAAEKGGFSSVKQALNACTKVDGANLYRREFWQEMFRTIDAYETGNYESLRDAAWHIRNQVRVVGNRLDHRIVSRTLLIKGLEFDHVIVADADLLTDPKNLYVALTRGSKSLTIISDQPVLHR
ncbi:MAG: hypothetical protein DWQ07_17265 [Chloroflexi bacterium]|nr:MAG: hypothetical protein DWQ07_17265 [Chloroflexota bacterium]MBL1195156.1 hypothetical protein [Chloroflexota bacterium]NOH12441.1 AAA family ATPase [Chloroflexota bacterium]